MAIVGDARPISSTCKVSDGQIRTYTSLYEVITNDVTDSPLLVLTATGLPEYGSPYVWYNTQDDWAFVTEATAQIREVSKSRLMWQVTVTHTQSRDETTRKASNGSLTAGRLNPIYEPWEIRFSHHSFQRPVTKDRNGNPLQNTVEEPYIPAIQIDDSRCRVSLSKNMATLSLSKYSDSRDKVNSKPMWGLKKRQVKLSSWNADVVYYGIGRAYVKHVFEFDISFEKDDQGNVVGWTHVILNEGFRRFVDFTSNPTTRYQEITVKDQPIHKPVLLNEDGTMISKAWGDTPFYRKWEIYGEYDFTQLGIPDPLPWPGVIVS